MIVVSNTSPITNLAAIQQFDLRRNIYGSLHIAEAVWAELNSGGRRWPGSAEVEGADWISRHRPENSPLVATLCRDLDLGEAETITLAMDLGADLVLLDEREGRRAAARLGLRVTGVVGVLLEAKSRSLVQEVRSHLDALRHEAGFRIGNELYDEVLVAAGEAG